MIRRTSICFIDAVENHANMLPGTAARDFYRMVFVRTPIDFFAETCSLLMQ